MLFTTSHPIPQPLADTISRSILAIDAFAKVEINSANHQVLVNGALTIKQVAAALKFAGCDARAVISSEHVPSSSTCCGGCS